MATESHTDGVDDIPPINRLKFLCSYGGKILPRPGDGYLRYVGGETRVVAVPRDIRFSDLMKKLAALFEGDVVFKYQLMPEDLDALVSVRTDEDLKHMIDEYDRHEDAGNSKLRTFLFPSKPVEIDSQVGGYTDAQAMEQRYIDAINGIARANTNTKLKYVNSNANKSLFSISSACSSPNSPSPDGNLDFNGYQNSQLLMHRVWSSPALNSLSNQTHHNIPQHHHNYYQNYHQHQHHHQYPQHGYPSPRLPQDLPKGSGPQRLLLPALSVDRAEINRAGINSGINNHLTASHRARGCGCGCRKPDGTNYYFPQSPQDGNVPQSPREGGSVPRTPREGSYPQSPRVDTQDCSPWGPREPNYM